MSVPTTTQKALALRKAQPFQQFGQAGDITTVNGATGCTHTVLQFLILLWTGRMPTHDELSKVAGYPNQTPLAKRRGFYPSDVRRVVEHYKIPYLIFGQGDGKVTRPALTVRQLYEASKLAPIGIGHSYSYWPEWAGYTYKGIKADGIPNGYALPLRKAGRTQFSGMVPPRDGHFGCLLGVDETPVGFSGPVIYAWEPNHGSGVRPEKPAYDMMTSAQWAGVYNSYKSVLGRTQYALVPTRALPTGG